MVACYIYFFFPLIEYQSYFFKRRNWEKNVKPVSIKKHYTPA